MNNESNDTNSKNDYKMKLAEEEKRAFDAAFCMREFWWNRFERRRDFSWKICIALWTSLAAYAAILITGRIAITGGLSIILAILVTIFGYIVNSGFKIFVLGIGKAHKHDRSKSDFFESKIKIILHYEYERFLLDEEQHFKDTQDTLEHWSHDFYVKVTKYLLILVVSITWLQILGAI